MAISTRTRFEIFKRDRFTCAYCGRTPPQVLLHVDHIVARSAGGSDEPENLTTSCSDCNLGKSNVPLDEGAAPAVTRATVEETEERVAQAKAYARAMQEWRELVDSWVDRVNESWCGAFKGTTEQTDTGVRWCLARGESFPSEPTIRRFLEELMLHEVLDAIDVAAAWADRENGGWVDERTCRYFYGVCHHKVRERREGQG